MAEFGVKATELSGPSMAGAQALQPVQKDAVTFDTSWMDNAARAVGTFFADKPKVNPMTMAENFYADGMNKLEQQRDMGDITPEAYDKKRRSMFSKTVSAFGPELGHAAVSGAIGKLYSSMKEASGVSDDVDRSKLIAKAQDELFAKGVAEGVIPASFASDPQTYQMAINVMQDRVMDDERIKRKSEALKMQREQNADFRAGSKFDREQVEIERADTGRNLSISMAGSMGDMVEMLIAKGQADIKAGRPHEEVLAEVNLALQKQTEMGAASLVDFQAGAQSFKSTASAMQTLITNALDPTKLEQYGAAGIKLQVIGAQQAQISREPGMLEVAGMVNFLGPSAAGNVAVNIYGAKIATALFEGSQGKASSMIKAGDVAPQKFMNERTDQIFKEAKSGGAKDAQAVKSATEHVNSVLRGIGEIKDYDKVNLSEALKTLSGTSMKAMVEAGSVDQAALMAARVPYEAYVQKDLYARGLSMFNQGITLGGGRGRSGEEVSLQSQISISANEDGSMKVTPQFSEGAFKNDPGAQQRALVAVSQLNKNLGDFSTMLRIEAHSMGRTDYPKFLEEYGSKIFPNMFVSKDDVEKYKAAGYDWNGGDPAKSTSWIRRTDGNKSGN